MTLKNLSDIKIQIPNQNRLNKNHKFEFQNPTKIFLKFVFQKLFFSRAFALAQLARHRALFEPDLSPAPENTIIRYAPGSLDTSAASRPLLSFLHNFMWGLLAALLGFIYVWSHAHYLVLFGRAKLGMMHCLRIEILRKAHMLNGVSRQNTGSEAAFLLSARHTIEGKNCHFG